MRRSNRKTLIAALREAKWDLESACDSLGITPAQLAIHMTDQDLDASWLAIQAQIDLQVMQRANRMLDLALDQVEDTLQHGEDPKYTLTAAKMAIDLHGQMAERVQIPAQLKKLEDAMAKFGFDSEG
jgi:hypothetical protein